MKIQVKGLGSTSVELEVQAEETVWTVKERLEGLIGKPAGQQKLIRLGKILPNDSLLSACGVKDNDQIVLMIDHAKTVPRPVEPAQLPAPSPAPVQAVNTQRRDYIPEAELVLAPSGQQAVVSLEAVGQLVELGFPYDQCVRALRVAQGDISGAIELLTTRPDDDFSPTVSFDVNSEDVQELVSKPAFLQLREMLIARPQLLSQVLEQIEMSNPRLATMIARFPEEFKKLLTEPLPEVRPVEGEEQVRQGPAVPAVVLSDSEEADVQSLAAFGFRYEDALEVYLVCGKSVDTAASYLFENYKPI